MVERATAMALRSLRVFKAIFIDYCKMFSYWSLIYAV